MTTMLFGRGLARKAASSTMWCVLAGIIGGSTIWTSHFISLLGLETHDGQLFFLFISLGTLLLSMIMTSAGFVVAGRVRKGPAAEIGGAMIGIAFASNHVMSVYALNIVGVKSFDPFRLVLAVVCALAFGILAANRRMRAAAPFCRYGAAAAFALGILSVHYIGVSGLTIYQGLPDWMSDIGIPDRYLFTMVVFFGSMTLGIGGVVFLIDHHSTLDRVRALEYRAFHDPLTGLPNRARLEERLAEAAATPENGLAVAMFDLNRFKSINDVHGIHAGDFVLKTIAVRLAGVLKDGETVSRTGGDEFIGLKTDVTDEIVASEFAARVRSAVIGVVEWEGQRLTVGSSIGVAMFPRDGESAEDLMVKADLAMHRAKRGGKTAPVFYCAATDEPNRTKSKLQLDLRLAIARHELELFYQKQNDITDSRLVGYEVLLRWNHPERGAISPDVFIPIAERDGYITVLGEWVLRKACYDAVSWTYPMKIAVNVAARQLVGDDLPKIVRTALTDSGLDASRLEIEITESGIIHDYDHALRIVKELKAIGVSIAMDDFGTGYSTLQQLQAFPFDKIKIDKAFIRDIADNPQSAAIMESTVRLGRSLNIAVLAEGVETAEHLSFLQSIGCTHGQGFYFGHPIPSEHFKRTKRHQKAVVLPFKSPVSRPPSGDSNE
nr:EAL domain-containing protein [Neorhizobium tomejilense]